MINEIAPPENIEALFKTKLERRKSLAQLPFEEKIRILVELQKMAQGFQASPKNTHRVVWDIST